MKKTIALSPYYQAATLLEAGVDEAGRGCLAGDLFAAAVIWSPTVSLPGINDSKQLSEKTRQELRPLIEEQAIAWSVARATVEEIGQLNILGATMLAMRRAIEGLSVTPELLLIDGNRFVSGGTIPHVCLVRGDARYLSIAAASILAKTHRDAYMEEMHARYPQYEWAQNKGYPTKSHRQAIAGHGASPLHRPGFRLLPKQGLFPDL